jgi:hypothetical protein
MNELTKLALELQEFCEKRQWSYCMIGGLAVQHWGEPRFTKDVDMTLLTGFGDEESYIAEWVSYYPTRLPGMLEFALQNRVLLLSSQSGIGIDIALGGLPFEEAAVGRAKLIEVEENSWLRLCSAEDLIIMKAFAGRALDWHDVRGVIVRQGGENLDWDLIWSELTPLAEIKDEPELISQLVSLKDEVSTTPIHHLEPPQSKSD